MEFVHTYGTPNFATANYLPFDLRRDGIGDRRPNKKGTGVHFREPLVAMRASWIRSLSTTDLADEKPNCTLKQEQRTQSGASMTLSKRKRAHPVAPAPVIIDLTADQEDSPVVPKKRKPHISNHNANCSAQNEKHTHPTTSRAGAEHTPSFMDQPGDEDNRAVAVNICAPANSGSNANLITLSKQCAHQTTSRASVEHSPTFIDLTANEDDRSVAPKKRSVPIAITNAYVNALMEQGKRLMLRPGNDFYIEDVNFPAIEEQHMPSVTVSDAALIELGERMYTIQPCASAGPVARGADLLVAEEQRTQPTAGGATTTATNDAASAFPAANNDIVSTATTTNNVTTSSAEAQLVPTLGYAELARDYAAVLVELAVIASKSKCAWDIEQRVMHDVKKRSMLAMLHARTASNGPISDCARTLLTIVQQPGTPYYRCRAIVFTVLTGYTQSWWKRHGALISSCRESIGQ